MTLYSDDPYDRNDSEAPEEAEDNGNGEKDADFEPDDESSQVLDAGGEEKPEGPSLEEIAREALELTREILGFFPRVDDPAISCRVDNDSIWVDIEGDPTGRLIGRKGQTIDAFQHLVSKIISHRLRRRITINLDAEDYKKRQREKLIQLAERTADYVSETGEARALEPMSPADRRIVHITLRGREDVITASEGREPSRFVVIWPEEEEEEE